MRLAYDRNGTGAPALFLHGWPGLRRDWRRVVPLVADIVEAVAPDLRGFGDSPGPDIAPADGYVPANHVEDIVALLDELGWERTVVVAYDLGATIAQALACAHPQRVSHLVLCAPPYGGIGTRRFSPRAIAEGWYQGFHQTTLVETMMDGRRDNIAAYLQFLMRRWNAPDDVLAGEDWDALLDAYARPGAFTRSVRYYRARAGQRAAEATAAPVPLATPATILWGEDDPIMRPEYADRLSDWFADFTLERLAGVGHLVPQQTPEAVARAIRRAVRPDCGNTPEHG